MKIFQVGISIVVLAVAAAHSIWPSITIDSITVALVVIAIAPWIAPLLKTLELPGGTKIEFREFEKAKEKAEEVGLLSDVSETRTTPEHSFLSEDPKLALAGLRIEIEKRLRTIVERLGIPSENRSVGSLLRSLSKNNILSGEEISVLLDMVGLLNGAVDGRKVDSQTAHWALDVGPRILKGLDERLKL